MSTSIKRVALVAVAALGLGVLSVAPSTAVTNADALAVSATTAAQTTAETATATSATTTLTYLAGATTDTMSVTASLVSAPAGATALPYLQVVETASAQAGNGNLTVLAAGTGSVSPNTAGLVWPTAAPAAVSAKFKVYLGQGSATTAPTTVGTYVVKLTPAVVAGGGSLNATAQTITITVTAAPTLDTVAASATVVLNKGETNVATTDDVVTSTKAVSTTDAAATITVALKNAAGSAVTAESYTATISGPGTLGSAAMAGASNNGSSATGRALTVRNGDVVGVFPDGTAGVSTITISSAAGKVLASKTVTFYGAIASIVTTVAKPVIGVRTDATAVTAKAYDAAGVLVSSGNLYLTSADTTIISNSATSAAIDATTGVATWSLVGVKAGSTTVVVANAASSATVSAAAAAVRVGGTSAELANVKVTTDKSVYAPGEIATITVTPVDAAGLALADDTYTVFATGGITPSYVLGSSSDTISGTQVVGTSAGVKTYKVYLPIAEGDVKFSWTTGTLAASTANSAVAGSLTVNVSSASTNAAIDAANEASAAASDATDAALAAADAADAATAAAQDAVDAVAALSTQVNKLISALKAQITTLTNLVIKIQKKVKA